METQLHPAPPPDEDDPLPPAHSPRMRLFAFLVAAVMLGFVALTAGGSYFGRPPTPDNTRPVPFVPPAQGAIR